VWQRLHSRPCARSCLQAKKAGDLGDEDFLRLAAEDAELKRARERLTLKHRNSSQWARRALKRGLTVMDPGAPPAPGSRVLCRWPAAPVLQCAGITGYCWHALEQRCVGKGQHNGK
jgi:hypothetical protein